MNAELVLGDIVVDVVFKEIKHVHLSVHPPLALTLCKQALA